MFEQKYKDALILLVNEEVSFGKTFYLRVSTFSMFPFLKPQDKILVRKFSVETSHCGDIIVFRKDEDIYTHRLLCKGIKQSKIILITKADNSFIIDEPVSEDDVLGKVIGVERGNRVIDLESTSWKMVNRSIGIISYIEGIIYNGLRKCKRLCLRLG